jgi:hypothetical protein
MSAASLHPDVAGAQPIAQCAKRRNFVEGSILAAGEDQLLGAFIQMPDREFVRKRAPILAMHLGQQFDRGNHGVAPTRSAELKGREKARRISAQAGVMLSGDRQRIDGLLGDHGLN